MVDYIPIITTAFALVFFIHLYQHARSKPQAQHLLWWTIGIATYGLGTLTESINAIWGWQLWNFKLWYIMGALLGGIPLAQGSVYLLLSKKFGNTTSLIIYTPSFSYLEELFTPHFNTENQKNNEIDFLGIFSLPSGHSSQESEALSPVLAM
jgi:hypothetical protein